MKKESKLKFYLELGAMAIAVFGTLKLFQKINFVASLKPDTSEEKYIMIAGLLIMIFIVLAIHELGHLLVGVIQGFKFQLFVVGPLGIKREDDKIQVYLNKNLGYYGGVAATSPADDNPNNPKKFAYVLLAGPIASVIFAVICLFIAYLIGKPLGIVFFIGGAMSIAIFFATTIPSKTGMFFTDRKRYQRLVTPGKAQDIELAMLRIMGKFSKDNSYKNVDEEDIRILISDETPFTKLYGYFNLICYQLEHQGAVDQSIEKGYKEAAEGLSSSFVSALDKEIEKYKDKLQIS